MMTRQIIIILLLSICSNSKAQEVSTLSDSVWADHLYELIKCVSTDQITERISTTMTDSANIPALTPALRLSTSDHEKIKKEYNKVSYTCCLNDSPTINEKLNREYTLWYNKLKRLLSMWDVARLKNSDDALKVADDYFFTNSEDETSLRLDIVHDNGYHVRLRIF